MRWGGHGGPPALKAEPSFGHSPQVSTVSVTHPGPAESSGVTLDAETHKIAISLGDTKASLWHAGF